MEASYHRIQITTKQAAQIALQLYHLDGEITLLPGELDFNFKIKTSQKTLLLKISRPQTDEQELEFQKKILQWVNHHSEHILSPLVLQDWQGNSISKITDEQGRVRLVRLLSFIPGRLWSSVNPQNKDLLFSLGKEAGKLTQCLQGFEHPMAKRNLLWDLAQADWTKEYFDLFEGKKLEIIQYFHQLFDDKQTLYQSLRKSVVHNDANDNNVIVSDDLLHPKVRAIIDYGDAVFTQSINDLAIAMAYAVMNKEDVLEAVLPIIQGYHQAFPLQEEELEVLYTLVAMRLIISVCKSAINQQKEPENIYLQISEKPAWEVLKKWRQLSPSLAHYSFRSICGFSAHPKEEVFKKWASQQNIGLNTLFPEMEIQTVKKVDMSVESTWMGHESDYLNNAFTEYKLQELNAGNSNIAIAGGYLETRPFYITKAYQKESNNGPIYRSVHLGMDVWVEAQKEIHARG